MEETAAVHTTEHKDVYAIVTEKILEQLDKGVVPWQLPWRSAGIPCNAITGRPYRSINLMLLAMLGYEQNLFLTYKQITDAGGKVKRDEKGHIVVFWKRGEKPSPEAILNDEEELQQEKVKAVLRYYMVFNIEQCENLPVSLVPPDREVVFNQSCEDLLAAMPVQPDIRYKENRAYYDPLRDYINMPKRKSFTTDDGYYATLFHEIAHWTGHRSRCNRPGVTEMAEFGSQSYSLEELVAEITSCNLQSITGIVSQFEQSVTYIKDWSWKFKQDRKMIIMAASLAQKATDYILHVKSEVDEQ